MPLIEHSGGNYRFLPGIAPYSCGVVSVPGFEIVHVTLTRPLPYRVGFERIEEFLATAKRPKAALCAMELRSPRPFSFEGFIEFNAGYAAILKSWGLFVDGVNPVARTNVAPELHPPAEPVLFGFSYTREASEGLRPTFVIAGGGELPEGALEANAIVCAGDSSPAGIKTKARFVMDLMERRLYGIDAGWHDVSAVNVYTVHSIDGFLRDTILGRMGPLGMQSIHWHYSRPPIQGIEFEMDLRGVRTEMRLD